MTRTTIRRPRWVLAWTLASLLGFALGFTVVFIGGWFVVEALTGDADRILAGDWGFYLQLTLGFGLGGAGAMTGQWLLLRRRVDNAGGWILAGALGFAVVAVLYLALYERIPLAINEIVHNLAGGAVLGLIQMPIVHRLTGRSRAWLAVTAPTMLLAGVTAALLRQLGIGDDLGGPLAVAALALVSGIVLSGWIANPRPLPTPTGQAPAVPSPAV